ncbi:conserved hypothetical protein [Ricinus communis]|uniref:Uncharacterized protein n=1 Tax=Ricinus communis TaxID=3988 RepID=B9RJP2_RICCO|nr:conserved hypothetical protein [Ricinus communis]
MLKCQGYQETESGSAMHPVLKSAKDHEMPGHHSTEYQLHCSNWLEAKVYFSGVALELGSIFLLQLSNSTKSCSCLEKDESRWSYHIN